ncbi:NAD(P)H-dependent oxidoreductase [Bacillus gaemokensis]|uniref:NAD(P)H oxidoreductase n=1 Tax=Bacillus gaemokensis TaxID=574375 RepID=A0A073K7U7_9BACI|nr:NAD(P)H-dependent oxidoreductase [Bacillus gaemokensis]KEK22645.1 NAD(P)H oxidoreductase [Bacillus gaemokensis]KYG28930.1 NAD(P)H oxidoreductase [Bacillus gaemokensis]
MKTLVIVAHPDIEKSQINKRWVEELEKHSDEITVHQLYKTASNWEFDIEYEQRLLLEHDRYIFQFPFYWYSSPPLLKKWFDDVLTYGFAYGSTGDKVRDKEFGLAISIGGLESQYQGEFTMDELTKPFQSTCLYTGMKFIPMFTLYGAEYQLKDEDIEKSAAQYVKYVMNKSSLHI